MVPLVLAAIGSDQYEGQEVEIEIKEGALTCLESLVVQCRDELKDAAGLVRDVVEKAKEMIKFDPNYAGGDDEDDEDDAMDVEGGGDDEDDLDEDDFEDELSSPISLCRFDISEGVS